MYVSTADAGLISLRKGRRAGLTVERTQSITEGNRRARLTGWARHC